MTIRRRSVFGLVLVLVLAIMGSSVVSAGKKVKASKVEKKFGGKILTSDKGFPASAKSENAYIAKLKKQTKVKFWEDKATKDWTIYFAAFFKKPLADLEYFVKIYDISDGKAMKASFSQFTTGNERSLKSYVVLDRKTFGVNRSLLMVIESDGRVVAAGKFKILGEAEKFTGKVDFSEDDEEEE